MLFKQNSQFEKSPLGKKVKGIHSDIIWDFISIFTVEIESRKIFRERDNARENVTEWHDGEICENIYWMMWKARSSSTQDSFSITNVREGINFTKSYLRMNDGGDCDEKPQVEFSSHMNPST